MYSATAAILRVISRMSALPSLQTYLLVEQNERRIYAYARAEGEWLLTEYENGVIPLPCLETGLDVGRIYAGLVE